MKIDWEKIAAIVMGWVLAAIIIISLLLDFQFGLLEK